MSLGIPSAEIAALRRTANEHDARALAATADEEVACRCAVRLLITASTEGEVKTLAQRIHAAGSRAQGPFVHLWARDFPVEPQALREYCGSVLDRAAGGSMLIDAVDEMPTDIQDVLIERLAALEFTRGPFAAVRLISGTTVSLLDRIAAGMFSEQLFYRLNVIHLVASDGPLHVTGPDDPQDGRVDDRSTPKLPR